MDKKLRQAITAKPNGKYLIPEKDRARVFSEIRSMIDEGDGRVNICDSGEHIRVTKLLSEDEELIINRPA